MKIKLLKILLISGLGMSLFSGCVTQDQLSNPDVQTGAAVGAVTGAVIGGNVGEKSGTNIATGAVLGALAGGAIGNAASDGQPTQNGGWE